MIRKNAVSLIANSIPKNFPIISANGFISRDLFETCDKKSNFYMIGSMGLASSIGLGVATKNPNLKVFVFDGDGNILMNLGSLVTIGSLKPKNLIHIIFDNHVHESTGGQPTNSKKIDFDKLGKSMNYNVLTVSTQKQLVLILKKLPSLIGPLMLVVKIKQSNIISKRVKYDPELIHSRFMNSLKV